MLLLSPRSNRTSKCAAIILIKIAERNNVMRYICSRKRSIYEYVICFLFTTKYVFEVSHVNSVIGFQYTPILIVTFNRVMLYLKNIFIAYLVLASPLVQNALKV